MKKYGLMIAGILVLTFSLSFSSGLFAEEGDMHEMMEHGEMGMEKGAENVVIDPVCGMKIKPEDAAGKSEYKGTTYYFCMDADKKAFDQDPGKYIAGMVQGEDSGEMHKQHEMEGHEHEIHEQEGEKGEMEKPEKDHPHEMEGEGHHEMKHEAHWMAPAEEAAKPNPVEATEESLAKSAEIFKEKCVICHGEEGAGDGILSETLDPKPIDLTGDLTRSHPDGDLFYKVSKGKGAMPAWEATLSKEERWGMVNFIRSLGE